MGGGGSYGGMGGNFGYNFPPFGQADWPSTHVSCKVCRLTSAFLCCAVDFGCGGATAGTEPGAAGGGSIVIQAAGTVTMTGTLSCDGQDSTHIGYTGDYPGAGSGGGILVVAVQGIAGIGPTLRVNGGFGNGGRGGV